MGNLNTLLLSFMTIFLAELGDKTQLAIISLSAKTGAPIFVFLGASLAMCILSFLGAYMGSFLIKFIPKELIEKLAGIIFILIGIFMIFKGK
jgi:putative Ca2+/H+ antiporter (TMEM165/GDT1 family)